MVKPIEPSAQRILMNFEDNADRKKAVCRNESKKSTESCSESVYVPSITYPILVKLANVNGLVNSEYE